MLSTDNLHAVFLSASLCFRTSCRTLSLRRPRVVVPVSSVDLLDLRHMMRSNAASTAADVPRIALSGSAASLLSCLRTPTVPGHPRQSSLPQDNLMPSRQAKCPCGA